MGKHQSFIIEVSTSGEVSACRLNGMRISPKSALGQALRDCVKPGDAEESCRYVMREFSPVYRIVRRSADGTYCNALASDEELTRCAKSIYFESETDFAVRDNCELYIVWSVAADYVENVRNAE